MTKRPIIYTLLSEGIAESCFIPSYLKKIAAKGNIELIKSKKGLKRSTNPSKSKVYKNLYTFAQSSIADNEDLFIAGVDLDQQDHILDKHKGEITNLKQKLNELKKNTKIILFVPIQVFDTWLLYHIKPIPDSLEAINGKDIKKELYGHSNPNSYVIEKKCKEILEQIDYGKLAKQSKSFKHFHDQVIKAFKIK